MILRAQHGKNQLANWRYHMKELVALRRRAYVKETSSKQRGSSSPNNVLVSEHTDRWDKLALCISNSNHRRYLHAFVLMSCALYGIQQSQYCATTVPKTVMDDKFHAH
jgi:hypothetical protein